MTPRVLFVDHNKIKYYSTLGIKAFIQFSFKANYGLLNKLKNFSFNHFNQPLCLYDDPE